MTKKPRQQRLANGGSSDGANLVPPHQKASETTDPYATGYDFVLVNGPIDERLQHDIAAKISEHLAKSTGPQNKKIVLALVTYGGLPNAAYKIGRYLQSIYDEVVGFVPSICKSAGTLIVTGCHKLIISPFGEIGPLDVQLMQRDELLGRRSGLTTKSALEDLSKHSLDLFQNFVVEIISGSGGAVSFKLAADISARMSAQLMSKIYEQINPDALGQDARDLNIATEYCKRLNKRGKNIRSEAIERLVHGYPSHDFVIDLEEAQEIFQRVEKPSQALYDIMKSRAEDMIVPRQRTPLVEIIKIGATSADQSRSSNAEGSESYDGGANTPKIKRDDRRAPPSSRRSN